MSWKNEKKKIKNKFKSFGYCMPESEQCRAISAHLDLFDMQYTFENLHAAYVDIYGKHPMKTEAKPFTQQYCVDAPKAGQPALACTPSPNPDLYDTVNFNWVYTTKGWSPVSKSGSFYPAQEGINPMNTLNATATVNTKTDLQTQREYLLGRWNDICRSSEYGRIDSLMTDAFNLNVENEPKTSKELFDGIKSGKFTLDEKKVPLQEIAAARGSSFYDEDDTFVHLGPTWAINWGGLTPDRLGYEKAKDAFRTALKLAKDEIMTGDPATSVKTLQDLENWAPPVATLPN